MAHAQTAAPQTAPPQAATNLESVLATMDKAAAEFKSAEADFVWDTYQKVVNETDTQKGKIYFRRSGKKIQMGSDITAPAPKYVLYDGDKVQIYEPKIDQVTQYRTAKNRGDFETFLVLGFGGGGHELRNSFEVKFAGVENVDGIRAARLDLAPRSERARSMFSHILLWIDLTRGIAVRQQLLEPSGDYRDARYSNIRLNQDLPRDVFKLKTTSKTRVVTPQ
ncbi:MAG TPA: outer membrane lipoprotein carrier protein LolA [Terriglobales bacterium]|nr:outer membrane lipoprotein carrier protein LolA [Terriglobales bacterium]